VAMVGHGPGGASKRRFKRYPAYKASGVAWLGEIPTHWSTFVFRRVLRRIEQGWSPVAEDRLAGLDEWAVIKLSAVNKGRFLPDQHKALPPYLAPDTRYEIHEGDFLLTRANTPELVGDVCIAHGVRPQLLLCDLVYRLQLRHDRLCPTFLGYWLASSVGRYQIEVDARGSSQSMVKVSQGHIRAWRLLLPPEEEQRAIAVFLDRETVRIDGLVAKEERLIELLQEKRAALITRAVTKGLDPSVSMRDSGVEWLPEIPAHWDVKPNGSLFQERDERRRDDLPILEVSIASGVRVREFSESKVEQRSDDLGAYKVASAGDIAFNKMRMWQGAVGTTPEDGLVSPDYIVAKPCTGTDPAYYAALFRTSIYMAEVYRWSHGIVDDRNRLYWDGFKAIRSPFPPSSEQRGIAFFVDYEATRIDALIAKVRGAIDRLKELRTALISAAVTGKIDVRAA